MRLIFVAVVGWTATASAQPSADPPAADEPLPAMKLFLEGRALLDAHQPAAACEKFEASLKLEADSAGPMLNLGLCNEQLDKLATAVRWFRRVETRAAELKLPDAESAAKDKSTAIAPRVPTIRIAFTQPQPHGSAVTVDGRRVDDVDLSRLELDAGHHLVELVGFAGARQEIDLADGDAKTVELVVPLPPPPPRLAPAEVSKHYVTRDPGATARRNAYIVGGAGVGLLIGDSVLLAIAKRSYDATEQPATRESWHNVARYGCTSMFVVGAGAVAAGAWMYMHAPDKERVEQTIVAPVIDRGRVGLAVQGAF